MKISQAKVGTRVIVTGAQSDNTAIVGRKGVIVREDPANMFGIAVRFYKEIEHGHACGGLVPFGRGYWFFAENLKKAPAVKK